MTITFRGGVLVATGVFAFLLARLTQVPWLYMLDAILWGAILLSLVVPWLAVMSLSARRRIVRREGEGRLTWPSRRGGSPGGIMVGEPRSLAPLSPLGKLRLPSGGS